MRQGILAALAGAAALLCAGQASATIVTDVWSGTVASGVDTSGIFGAAGADLSSSAFTATFTFNTDLGTLAENGHNLQLYGGAGSGGTSPGTVSITINGATYNFSNSTTGTLVGLSSIGGWGMEDQTWSDDENFYIGFNGAPLYSLPTSFGEAYSGGPCSLAISCFGGYLGIQSSALRLTPDMLTISASGPVMAIPFPEPASWAMMLLGFFGMGAATRFQRRRVAA